MDAAVAEMLSMYQCDSKPVKISEGENFVYEFGLGGKPYILRVAEETRRRRDDLEAETEYIEYLNSHKGPAVVLVKARDGASVVTACENGAVYNAFCYEKAPGSFPGNEAWDSRLFAKFGKMTGKMHSLADTYVPKGKRRYDWRQDCESLAEVMDGSTPGISKRFRECAERIAGIPINTSNYGLCHFDLHAGNMTIHEGRIYVFDFDDSQYGYYLQDAATALFFSYGYPDFIKGFLSRNPRNTVYANSFLKAFFKGYREEHAVDSASFACFGDMLAYQRFVLFACLEGDEELGPYLPLYEKWKHEILEDEPVIDMDFSEYAHADS